MRKEVVGCFQAVMGNKKFLVQFEDGQKREISFFPLLYVCSKEDVCIEMDDPISDHNPKKQGDLLTIDRDPVVAEAFVFERGAYFSVFYFLCYVKEI